jgi:hypothetical protein
MSAAQVTCAGVSYPEQGRATYIVASADHARRLFIGDGMKNVRAAAVEMTTEDGGACVVSLTIRGGKGRYEVTLANNGDDVVERELAPCCDVQRGAMVLFMVAGKDVLPR